MATRDLLRRRPLLLRILVSVVAVGTLQGLQLLLWELTQPSPFMLSLAAVMFAAWYGGALSGWIATGLALPGIDYFFLVPYRTWSHTLRLDVILSLLLFAVVGAALSYLLSLSNRALVRAQREIDERRRVEAERDHFISALGHDLRNPLNAIKVGSHLLLCKAELSASLRDPVGRIATSADRMERLIIQLLDFARVRSDGLRIERQRVDLAELCRDVIAEQRLTCGEDCDIELRTGGNAVGEWDRDRLQQVLQNLVGNAVEHRTPDSAVLVDLDPRDGGVRLVVENQAPPFAPDELSRLFEPFSRVSKRKTGLGLGLFIARQIVEAHGGSIRADSRAERVRFEITLPRGQDIAT